MERKQKTFLNAILHETGERILVTHDQKGSPFFVDVNGKKYHIERLDLSEALPMIPMMEESNEQMKSLADIIKSFDMKEQDDHRAKIAEREYWRKLRDDIFIAMLNKLGYKIQLLDDVYYIINVLKAQDQKLWLEKQGNKNETINNDEFAKGVLRGAAINLITWIDYNAAEGNMCLSNTECKDITDALVNGDWNKIYAYMKKKLEKQGERKPIFNVVDWQPSKVDGKIHNIYNAGVEPKFHRFHEGDLVACEELNTAKIINIVDDKYEVEFIDGNKGFPHIDYIDRLFHLWTIADAKPGDILATNKSVFIYAEILYNKAYAYCGVDKFGVFKDNCLNHNWTNSIDNIHPATKEQRDTLFAKMKEAGYEWNAEKKELKKIEEQPSQWDISDYRTWQYIVSDVFTKHDGIGQYLDDGFCQKIAKYMQENWSKKLSLGQNPTKWSEEDDKILDKIITALMGAENVECADYNIMYNWLESLKERIGE